MDPTKLKATRLNELCSTYGLTTSANKVELIRRLQDNDPTDAWLKDAYESHHSALDDFVDEKDSTNLSTHHQRSGQQTSGDQPTIQRAASLEQREIEFLRKEHELTRRELELTRRELEFVRASSPSVMPSQPTHHTNINSIKDLLSEFEGDGANFRKWRDQFKLLKTTYKLTDEFGRLLLGSKLKGKALRWFLSKPEYIRMIVDGLLEEIGSMFDHREDRLTLRRRF